MAPPQAEYRPLQQQKAPKLCVPRRRQRPRRRQSARPPRRRSARQTRPPTRPKRPQVTSHRAALCEFVISPDPAPQLDPPNPSPFEANLHAWEHWRRTADAAKRPDPVSARADPPPPRRPAKAPDESGRCPPLSLDTRNRCDDGLCLRLLFRRRRRGVALRCFFHDQVGDHLISSFNDLARHLGVHLQEPGDLLHVAVG